MLEWDEDKRRATLSSRGLDFANVEQVFDGFYVTVVDNRRDYGETRYQTVGMCGVETVFLIWTWRGLSRRIISMKKCDGQERRKYDAAASRRG